MKNIFLKSKAKSLQKTGGGDSQKNVHHLGVASEMPPRCLRDASVSIYSCQSDFSSRVWKYVACMLIALCLGIGNVWGANPYYASQDWGSDDFSSVVANHTNVVITSSATAFNGNFSGKYYIQCGSSSEITSGYMRFAATEQIDSVSIFFIGNSTTAAGISWCGWGKNVTPSVEVGSNYGSTATFAYSTKNYANARWMTIDVSDKNLYTLQIFRQGKNLTNNGNKISNFGANQTINILGIKVWLHPAAVTKYTITYAKGEYGTGDAIANGEKTKDVAFTLSSSTYSRENYTQQGWSTTDGGAKAYDLGGSYTANADITLYPFWVSSAAATHDISYTNTKGATNSNPAKYTEGVGVASFEPLADVTDFHFNGWSPASISTTATDDQTIEAQWVAAYDVTFSAGAGSGTVPASFQKWEGAKFNLPGQGEMVAPSGKAFDGWKASGAGAKLAANTEYTMVGEAVEFVAQWKKLPQTIFHWQSNISNNPSLDQVISATGGSLTTRSYKTSSKGSFQTQSVSSYVAGTPDDMKVNAGKSGVKCNNSDVYLKLALTSGKLQSGDTIWICGYGAIKMYKSITLGAGFNDEIASLSMSGTSSNTFGVNATACVIPQVGGEDVEYDSLCLTRNSSAYLAAIKIVRPAAKDVKSTVVTLSDAKVNGTSISAANLATLQSSHTLALSDALSAAPTIIFNKHTVITYDDNSEKETDTPIEETATINSDGKWKASATIEAVEYTITIPKAVSTDATLSSLTVNGSAATVDALDATKYTFTLPFGTTAVPTVVATPNDANAVANVTANTLSGATIEVVPESGEGDKVTYTITYTIVDSKDIRMAWATSVNFCSGATKYSSAVKSDNALVSAYINKITFTNVEGSGDDGAEGGSLNVGKKAGNMFTLSAKPGYAMKAMTFAAKIQDANCEYSLNGGAWQTLTSTGQSDDKCYEVFADAEVHEFRLRSTGTSGVWIRNMELSIITACTPIKLTWTAEPAAEYEVGKAASAIAATANNGGAVAYSTTASGIVEVAANGALTIAGLGSATLKAATAEGDGTAYCANGGADIVISKAVNTYYLVKFNAQNETAVNEVKYYSGDDAIALPTEPSYSGFVFQGWFDAASAGNAVAFPLTPESSRTIYAQWVAECTGPTITAQPASANYLTGRVATALACEATAGNGGELTYTWYSCDNAERTNPVALAGAPTPSTAVAGTFYYYCAVTEAGCDIIRNSDVATITVEDKEPVCIIKSTPTSGTEATADGAYKGDAYFKGRASDYKLNSDYDYVGVELMAGKSFLATDKVVLNQAADLGNASDITKFYVFTETPASGKSYATVDNATPKKGDNWFTMPAGMAGESSLYIGRVDAKCNPTVGYLAVYRVMNPELMAIKINGRDGEIDALNDKHFNVTIPYEAVLTSLTVVPTIVRNAAHATTPEAVISNEGAWVFGNNTYRVMDKDGDYTDYTITLTRDMLKHTVSFNTHGGTSVASVEVVDGGYLAAAPTAPTKEDYIFQYWSESDGGAEIDVTTVQINDDKEFHAVWVSDGGIKLLNGTTVNTTNYITGVTASKVTISEVEYDCVAFAGTVSNVNASNMKNLNSHVTYNATTTQTKIMLSLYNSNGSNNRTIYVKGVVEGTDDIVDLAAIELNGGEKKTTEYIEFNNAKNRSIYIFVSSNAGDIKILQAKVIESGSALKKMGDNGYSLNMNKGRMFGAKDATISFEGMTYTLNGDYTPLSSEVLKVKSNSIVFVAAAPTLMKVTTANNNTYYVTKGSAGTDNETAKTGVSEFDLTAGTWYITAGGSEVQFTKIEFIAPKCEAPAFNALANSDICSGDAYVALDGTGTVSDGGSITYKWYAEGDAETVLATTATYMPEADGSYYVVALHHVDGYTDNEVTSDVVTVTTHEGTAITEGLAHVRKTAGEAATLTVEATGKDLHYAWKECETIDGTYTDVAGAADSKSLDVIVPDGIKYYKVIVSSGCGADQESIAKVEKFVPVAQVVVSTSVSWDLTACADAQIKLTETSSPKKGEECLMANIEGVHMDENFHSESLVFAGEYIYRTSSATGHPTCAEYMKFETSVPGLVRVHFAGNGDNRCLRITSSDGVQYSSVSAGTSDDLTEQFEVAAGEIELMGLNGDHTGNKKYMRFFQIEFYALDKVRDDSWIAPRELGTVCYPNGHIVIGADMYKMAGVNENGKFAFDQVEVTEPGVPYLFEATGYEPIKFYKTTAATAEEAGTSNGMVGTFVQKTLSYLTDENTYYFQGAHFYAVTDRSKDLVVPANRCYVDLNEPHPAAAPKAGVRRIVFGVNGTNSATGFENIDASEKPVKLMIDGKMYILRGEKMYDATGRLVK